MTTSARDRISGGRALSQAPLGRPARLRPPLPVLLSLDPVHAVGPVWGDGDEDNKLADAISGSLRVADELKCESISMPAISTGIFGFPKERAAGIIFSAIEKYFASSKESSIKIIRLVLFDKETTQIFLDTLAQ